MFGGTIQFVPLFILSRLMFLLLDCNISFIIIRFYSFIRVCKLLFVYHFSSGLSMDGTVAINFYIFCESLS
jgi:hypothetical protein